MKVLIPLLLLSGILNVALIATRPAAVVCQPVATQESKPDFIPPAAKEATPHPTASAAPLIPTLSARPAPHPASGGTDLLHTLGAVGPPQERQMLCDISEKSIRDRWHDDRWQISRDLRRDLADDAKQHEDMEKDVKEYTDALDLSSADREKFEDQYALLRADRVASIRESLDAEFPDYGAIATSVKEFFGQEDSLAQTYAGDSGVLRLRASQMESRTALLAIFLAMADKPWDDSVEW